MTSRAWPGRVGWWGLALALVLLSFALRVHDLGRPNLTNDEWFMLRNHDEGPLWIVHQAHTFEPHPLLYYLGLAGWIELAGRTELAMRFPSVVFGALLTPVLIALGRMLLGRPAALIVGGLAAINPYLIAESQNARNYAMVVALSALASLALVRALRTDRPRDWGAYAVAMLLALNTHYDSALILMVHGLYVLLRTRSGVARPKSHASPILANREVQLPRGWIASTLAVVALFGLWLLYAWPALAAYHGYFPTPVGIGQVLTRSLATFTLGSTVPARQAAPALAFAAASLAALGVRRTDVAVFLGLYVLLPIVVVSALFLVRPMFDARYLIVLAPGYLLVLAAGLDALREMAWPIGVLALAGALAMLLPTVPRTYQAMLTDRGDYRSMATWVSTYGSPTDPIVATGYGQAELFGYYYHGPRPVQVFDQPAALATALPLLLQSHLGVWLLPYWESPADQAALQVLNQVAAPVADRWFVNARALYFASPREVDRPSPARATWEDQLVLDHAVVSRDGVEPGEAVVADLDWRIAGRLPTPKVSLRLIDETGTTIGQTDAPLAATTTLEPGEVRTRLGALVPPVSPPGSYRLALLLYHPGDGSALGVKTDAPTVAGAVDLGPVTVGLRQRPVPLAEAGVPPAAPIDYGDGLAFLGHDPLGPPSLAGSWRSFRLLWRADQRPSRDLGRQIVLRATDGHEWVVANGPILPSFPTSKWPAGQLLAERVRIQIPPVIPNGRFTLLLRRPDAIGLSIELGEVEVTGPARSFTRPAVATPLDVRFGSFATLLGAQLGSLGAQPGQAIEVTLVWEARGTADRSYTVFVHLVDPSGQIRGQVDQPPLKGRRPTDGWIRGEYLVDRYDPVLPSVAPSGRYRVEVGLYDAVSGQRVPIQNPDGTISDHVSIGDVIVQGTDRVRTPARP